MPSAHAATPSGLSRYASSCQHRIAIAADASETAERVKRAKAKLTELVDAAAKAGLEASALGPPCWRCRYYEPTDGNGRCHNPVNHEVKFRNFDLEIGGYKSVDTMRAKNGLCGPESILFELASLPRRFVRAAPMGAIFGGLWIGAFALLGLLVAGPMVIMGIMGLLGFLYEWIEGKWQ